MAKKPLKLADFEGNWTLTRRILQKDAPSARFEGTALWLPDGDGMAYHESGTLMLDGQPPMQGERRYRWHEDLTVWFEDGRFFHQVPGMGGATRHWCDPDLYRVQYRFGRWPDFETVWRVTGPRKNYAMISHFIRLNP